MAQQIVVLVHLTMMMTDKDDDDDNSNADLPDMDKLWRQEKHKEREEYTIILFLKYPIPPKILHSKKIHNRT